MLGGPALYEAKTAAITRANHCLDDTGMREKQAA